MFHHKLDDPCIKSLKQSHRFRKKEIYLFSPDYNNIMSYSIRLGDRKYLFVIYKMFYYCIPVNCIAVNLVNKTETNKTSVIKTLT